MVEVVIMVLSEQWCAFVTKAEMGGSKFSANGLQRLL
jgi:hypothetical protein